MDLYIQSLILQDVVTNWLGTRTNLVLFTFAILCLATFFGLLAIVKPFFVCVFQMLFSALAIVCR
jgi:hypothetical protein